MAKAVMRGNTLGEGAFTGRSRTVDGNDQSPLQLIPLSLIKADMAIVGHAPKSAGLSSRAGQPSGIDNKIILSCR